MAGIRRRRVSAAVVLLMAAGCGGGSGAVTAPNTPKQIAADRATAKRAVLTSNDLPAGYKGVPHDESSSNDLPPAGREEVRRVLGPSAAIPRHFEGRSAERGFARFLEGQDRARRGHRGW